MSASDLHLVAKLNDKLIQASTHGATEEKLIKILNRLRAVTMTLRILEATHVGRTVNGLRKSGGQVGEVAKQLVKKWKKILPDNGHSAHKHSSKVAQQPAPMDAHRSAATCPMQEMVAKHDQRTDHPQAPAPPLNRNDKSEYDRGVTDVRRRKVATGARTSHKDASVCTSRQSAASSNSKEYLEVPRREVHSSHSISPTPPLPMSGSSGAVNLSPSGSLLRSSSPTRPVSPSRLSDQPSGKKRKGAQVDPGAGGMVVALSKRSRTAVYSGKRVAGQKGIPSLFDLCMEVLVNNIDAIEEVGGIPFFILEPVLQKCTPTQLMRLEEFNPHFLDDSDQLWEKHCQKEFRGSQPNSRQSWKELYTEKLAAREQKMKSITSSIRARQQAREEPVRKAILAEPSLSLGRKRRGTQGFFPVRGQFSKPIAPRPVLKQTLKMARHRQKMMSSQPARR